MWYCNHVFLPAIQELECLMPKWDTNDAGELVCIMPDLDEGEKEVKLWFHDESTFYANDMRKISRTGFLTRLKCKKVEIGQEKTL